MTGYLRTTAPMSDARRIIGTERCTYEQQYDPDSTIAQAWIESLHALGSVGKRSRSTGHDSIKLLVDPKAQPSEDSGKKNRAWLGSMQSLCSKPFEQSPQEVQSDVWSRQQYTLSSHLILTDIRHWGIGGRGANGARDKKMSARQPSKHGKDSVPGFVLGVIFRGLFRLAQQRGGVAKNLVGGSLTFFLVCSF
jgi:hypothetical protein